MLGPDYVRPEVQTPDAHRGQVEPAQAASFADLPWWEVFRDPALVALLTEAVENNRDLRAALARVEVARAQVGVARSPLFPWIGYEADAARVKNNIQSGALTTGASDVFFTGLDATWELDVWGRVRRSTEAARAELFATESVQRGILVSLVARVAQVYLELLELDLELEITRRSVEDFDASRTLFERRFVGGAGSKLPVTRAERARAETSAGMPLIEAQIAARENELCALLGRPPGPIARGLPFREQALAPDVPAGLPSDLLQRRPDIQTSEGVLRAANERVGASFANFFPRIGLTGVLGLRSDELEDLFDSGSDTWALVGTVAGPIFQGGFNWFRWKAAKQQWEGAVADYEQTVLEAFREVSDVLILREKLVGSVQEMERAVAAAGESVELSQVRYDGGLANYFEVLDAQLERYPTELRLARRQLDQQLAIVQLYRALGGGWQQPTPSAPAPSTAP
jgi:multidrug efflux system outer membrane protein